MHKAKLKHLLIFSTFALITGLTLVIEFSRPKQKNQNLIAAHKMVPQKPALSKFSLDSSKGGNFTEQSLLNHWTLVFFGYTSCPMICPANLSVIKSAWQHLPKNISKVPLQFVFVSLDGIKDSPLKLRDYLKNYNTNFIGLTGKKSAIEKLSQQLFIVADRNTKTGEIDHSANLMLIDPKGRLHSLFTAPFNQEELCQDLPILVSDR